VSAAVVGVDETGLRQSGKGGWVWLFRTPDASQFEVSPSRGSEVFERIMHGFIGVLVTDFYSVYTARTDDAARVLRRASVARCQGSRRARPYARDARIRRQSLGTTTLLSAISGPSLSTETLRGTRSPASSNALGHWMSVTQTLRKNGSHWQTGCLPQNDAWRAKQSIPSVFCPHY
jgi:Transposase IS66 family